MRDYKGELEALKNDLMAEFAYYNKQQSMIDKRLNELMKQNQFNVVAVEMERLIAERRFVKERCLELLPLRDMFRGGWAEAVERLDKLAGHKA